jgi:hypothetical protein
MRRLREILGDLMVITQAIHEADNEQEVYELLSAYLEAVRLEHKTHEALAQITNSPMVGTLAVMQAIEALVVALAAASRRLDDRSRVVIKDVLYVFCAAFDHLVLLRRTPRQSGCTAQPNAVRRVIAPSPQASGTGSGDVRYPGAIVSVPPQTADTRLSS